MTMKPKIKFLRREWVIFLVFLVACSTKKIDLSIKQFEIEAETLPLPESWRELHQGADGYRDENVSERWVQKWGLHEPDSRTNVGYNYYVNVFESVSLARRGYRQSVKKLEEHGFDMYPQPEWAYTSSFADQYTMYCHYPETTGETCYSVGQYRNFTIFLAITPGDGVSLEDCPKLFAAIDRHVQSVIESAIGNINN